MSDDPLLAALRSAAGTYRSGSALARGLGLTRAAVHKRMEKLRAAGHRIEGIHRLGYRLADTGPGGSSSCGGWRGGSVVRFDVLASTQDEAKRRAMNGAPEGTAVSARRQTSGRGRLGRAWASPEGGLWVSLLLRPTLPPETAPVIALAAALSWSRILTARGVDARVKWPNDLWVGERKLAGILTEMTAEIGRVQWLVLGVGVNVNNPPPPSTRVPSVSLRRLTRRSWDLDDLRDTWLSDFQELYQTVQTAGFGALRPAYESRCLLIGRDVGAASAEGNRRGTVLGVDDTGRLRVRTAAGEALWSAGEVSLLS